MKAISPLNVPSLSILAYIVTQEPGANAFFAPPALGCKPKLDLSDSSSQSAELGQTPSSG